MEGLEENDPALLLKFPDARETREWMETHGIAPVIKAVFTAIKRSAKKKLYMCKIYHTEGDRNDLFCKTFLESRGYRVKITDKTMFISWQPLDQ